MLTINKQTIEETKKKIARPEKRAEAVEDVKRMIEIKETQLWRADAGFCCGPSQEYANMLWRETELLQSVLKSVESGDSTRANSLLDDYAGLLQTNYSNWYPEFGRP